MLKQNYIAVTVAVLAGFAALPLAAQQRAEPRTPPRLEITMTLLPEKAKDATEITRKIELPVPGRDKDKGEGKPPAELPGAEHGKGQGLDTAAEARERGREFGQTVSEQARDNRENAGRRDDHPSGPPADLPVTPHNGGPPDTVPVPPKP
jgi:hypothetical protein